MNLVEELIKEGHIIKPLLIQAFRRINRRDFLPIEHAAAAEINAPMPIGYGQTVSQPLTVAFMLELLDPRPGDKILDVGSGSGWTTALLAHAVGATGRVYGLEKISQLAEMSEKNLEPYHFINSGRVKIINGDGYVGLPEIAPFDKILVSAASLEIPQALLAQLKIGGRLVMPLGQWHESQNIVLAKKIAEHKYEEDRYPDFIFVPLV